MNILNSNINIILLCGDIVVCIGMVNFVLMTSRVAGGSQSIVQRSSDSKTGLPIAAPPFVCLVLVRQPTVTLNKLKGGITDFDVKLTLNLIKVKNSDPCLHRVAGNLEKLQFWDKLGMVFLDQHKLYFFY